MTPLRPITAVYGPTAVGKTDYAWKLAVEHKANILSFDSRQCYVGMEIGTGVDLPQGYSIKNGVATSQDSSPLIFGHGLVHPHEDWSIAHFYEYAKPIVEQHRTNNTPLILVGGSWLYFSVLLQPPASLFTPPQPEQRALWEQKSITELQELVQQNVPERWEKLNNSDRNNSVRLIRALETAAVNGPIPDALFTQEELSLHVLNAETEALKTAVAHRITSRLQNGMLEETKNLMQAYEDWTFPAFSATGYQIIRKFLKDEIPQAEALILWQQQEMQYIKKQKTWIRWIENNFKLEHQSLLETLSLKPTLQIFE